MKTFAAALALATMIAQAPGAMAASGPARLAGPWAATIVGSTGCGLTTMYSTFTLDATGQGNATTTTHGQCGDSTATNPISITALYSNGSGTAHLSCGSGCGWDLTIQVLPGSKMFNLVDVSPGNPNNYIEGTAVHQ